MSTPHPASPPLEPVQGTWHATDFRFDSGAVLPTLRLAYTTIGDPGNTPVLILHGSNGSGASFLTDAFAGELFGPGQPLDTEKHFIILPDSIGCGRSSKPSDGLRMKFPHYNYDDAVRAQYLLLTQGLGVEHVRVLIGHSMGGMQAWLWAQQHPAFMDLLVPMAAQPGPMSGRNWMLRRMLMESIRNDPGWMGGDYTEQPRQWQRASIFFSLATNGGTHALQRLGATRAQADAAVDHRLAVPFRGDANDQLYQWNSSRDYDPSAALERIEAAVLAINAADDERNPPELGLLEGAVERLRNGRMLLIPGSADTAGHGTTENARLWKQELATLMAETPARSAG